MADRALKIFTGDDAPNMEAMMRPVEYPEETQAHYAAANLERGAGTRMVFCGEGENGFSLAIVYAAPGYVITRHSHDVDCVYYVLEGEITLGSQIVRKGGGFFVGAEQPYTYTAGPDGAEVLEMRAATMIGTRALESAERLDALRVVADERAEEWRRWLDARAARAHAPVS